MVDVKEYMHLSAKHCECLFDEAKETISNNELHG